MITRRCKKGRCGERKDLKFLACCSSFFFLLLLYSFEFSLLLNKIIFSLFFFCSLKKYKEKNSLGLVIILCSVGSNGPYQSEQWRKKKVKERKCVLAALVSSFLLPLVCLYFACVSFSSPMSI